MRPFGLRVERELSRLTGKSAGTLARELSVLVEAGLLLRRRVGNQVHFQANPDCPIQEELRGILKKMSGLADVLREALQPLAGRISAAFVNGSMARGDERPGSDVDVMVVGNARLAEVVKALAPAREVLRREINPNLYRPGEFDAALTGKERVTAQAPGGEILVYEAPDGGARVEVRLD